MSAVALRVSETNTLQRFFLYSEPFFIKSQGVRSKWSQTILLRDTVFLSWNTLWWVSKDSKCILILNMKIYLSAKINLKVMAENKNKQVFLNLFWVDFFTEEIAFCQAWSNEFVLPTMTYLKKKTIFSTVYKVFLYVIGTYFLDKWQKMSKCFNYCKLCIRRIFRYNCLPNATFCTNLIKIICLYCILKFSE